VRAGVRMRVLVCILAYPASTRMRHIVTSFVASKSPPSFSTLSHKLCDFQKTIIEYKKGDSNISTNFI
jgi:hypothetical protein